MKVASPSAYVVQKLLINNRREQEKRVKDMQSIEYVAKFILNNLEARSEMDGIISKLNKKKLTIIRRLIAENSYVSLNNLFE